MTRIVFTGVAIICLLSPVIAQTASNSTFPIMSRGEIYISKLKGMKVYNLDNAAVGEIADVAFKDKHIVDAYILSVGGFLGVGDRYVAVTPSTVSLAWAASSNRWTGTINATVDELKASPEFKYPG
jgi:hypothetical protein